MIRNQMASDGDMQTARSGQKRTSRTCKELGGKGSKEEQRKIPAAPKMFLGPFLQKFRLQSYTRHNNLPIVFSPVGTEVHNGS